MTLRGKHDDDVGGGSVTAERCCDTERVVPLDRTREQERRQVEEDSGQHPFVGFANGDFRSEINSVNSEMSDHDSTVV